jgi:cell division septum initiation protein DivIVA
MPRGKRNEDLVMLQMALIGYQHEKQRIDEKINEIQARLKGKSSAESAAPAVAAKKSGRVKRVLSASARKRIAAAQKKRWADHRKALAGGQA